MVKLLRQLEFSFPHVVSSRALSIFALLFIIAVVPLTVFLAQTRQDPRQRAAEKENLPKTQEEKPKAEFVKGEVLIKFKQDAPELEIRDEKKSQGLDINRNEVSFSDLEESALPAILREINQKYQINKLEKVFKGAEAPDKELAKFKQKFSQELSEGRRKINESEALKTDLSRIYKISVSKDASVEDMVKELSASSEVESLFGFNSPQPCCELSFP